MAQAIHREWLRLFVRLGPEFAPAPGSAPRSETGIAWAYYNLQGELVEDAFVFAGDRIEVTQDKSLLVPGPPVGKGPYLGQGYYELVEVLGQPTNSTPTAMATQHVFGNGAVVEVSRGMVVAIRGG